MRISSSSKMQGHLQQQEEKVDSMSQGFIVVVDDENGGEIRTSVRNERNTDEEKEKPPLVACGDLEATEEQAVGAAPATCYHGNDNVDDGEQVKPDEVGEGNGDKGEEEDDDDDDDDSSESLSSALAPPNELQNYYAWFMSDVLIYVTLINMGAEFTRSIKVESFTFSILAGLVLKIFLDIIMLIGLWIHQKVFVEHGRKILGGFLIWAVVFSSRFVILWIDDLIFQNSVELGGLLVILVVAFVLVVAGRLSRLLYYSLSSSRAEQCFVGTLSRSERYMRSMADLSLFALPAKAFRRRRTTTNTTNDKNVVSSSHETPEAQDKLHNNSSKRVVAATTTGEATKNNILGEEHL
ncbi:hypothetical protein ACA910_007253 [Epithemia clementina (nom. ined.)]